MRKLFSVMLLAAVAALATPAEAQTKGKGGAKGPPPGTTINACGCYKDAGGACICTSRRGKCVCPTDCEPKGCEERRQKEYEREQAAAIREAAAQDKKRSAEAAKKEKDEAEKAEKGSGEQKK